MKPTRTVGIDIDNGLANKAKKNIKYWTKKFRCPDIAEIFEFIGGNYLDETKIDNEEFDTVLWYVLLIILTSFKMNNLTYLA